MNIAEFFQKKEQNFACRLLKRVYHKVFLRSNKSKIEYLRKAGAKIGSGCTIGSIGILGSEPYLVEVGNNTYFSGISSKIFTHDGGIERLYYMGVAPKKFDSLGRVKIGNNCFIGHNCIIMKNVTIEDNCVIGAGAIVTKSVPSGSVVAGVPARVICTVEEYYEKNKMHFDQTIGWNSYEKRKYVEKNMDKYEKIRKQREV